MSSRVAVIGGGWAGIAAAVELTSAGQAVTLLEAGRKLGGRARGVELDGRLVDNGQHILLGAYRETLALMRRVGVEPASVLQRLPLQVVDNAGFRMALPRFPAPFNLAWGLLWAKGVGLREKIATALWMEQLKRENYRLPEDMSVSTWLAQAGQNGVLAQRLWGPLCLAALNTPPERASAQIFCNVLRDSLGSPRRADTDLLLPRTDLGALLPEPAALWLERHGTEIRFGQRIKDVVLEENSVIVDGEPYAAAIIATAPQHAAELTDTSFDSSFEPIATVYLAYPKDTTLPFPMQALQDGIGQWVIDRGEGLLACVLSGHGTWEQLDDQALKEALIGELGLERQPEWSGIIREKRATFSCCPGLWRPTHQTKSHALWLAGDYTWADYPATLEGAVRSGLRAARAYLNHGDSPTRRTP